MAPASGYAPSRLLMLVPLLALACSKGGDTPPTGTGPGADFAPNANTTLSGNVTYKSVTIPAGVTVTASSDLTLTVQGNVKVAGSLKGDCVAMTIKADGVFSTSGGTLDNSCAVEPDAGGPGVLIIGKAGIDVDGGELVTSGDLKMTNDPSQTLASAVSAVAAPGAGENQFLAQSTGGVPCRYRNWKARSIPASRAKGKNGTPKGDDGRDGRYKDLGPCVGGIIIDGLTMSGQKGGDGGDGTVTGSTTAEGGKGGNMGAVLITAPGGDIVFNGINTITTPDGGAGGNGIATGLPGGGSASAKGGAGGNEAPTGFGESPILIEATTGAIIVNGALNIIVGKAGDGGTATATGTKGNDGSPGQAGGAATATGGAGGKTSDKKFTLRGSVGGAGPITVSGGNAGKGGDATANGGVGRNGSPGAAGGKGGTMTARGGNGGNAQLKNQTGDLIGNGGAAGNARFSLGNGGAGGSNCPVAGGAGGGGGDAAGGAGTVGTGAMAGAAGNAQANNTANGGKGGDGNPAGGGGAAGANTPPANPAPGSFQPGAPGGPCPGGVSLTVTPPSQTISQGGTGSVRVVITRSAPFAGAVNVSVKDDQGVVLASQVIPATSTQADISFPVGAAFATGSHTFTITASGEGLTTVSQPFGVTVNTASTVSVTIKNGEQATRPWTLMTFKSGSGATQVVPISGDGSATVALPTTPTPVRVTLQQQAGVDRFTYDYQLRSDQVLSNAQFVLGNPPLASITQTITGLPANSYVTAFAGSSYKYLNPPNTPPFSSQLDRVEAGVRIAGGCVYRSSMTQEPISAVLKTISYLTDGTYPCDFVGGGVKNYVSSQTTVNGVAPGTPLQLTGGFVLNGIQSTIYSKAFTAPATPYWSLNGIDLPSGVSQFEAVFHAGTNASEYSEYTFGGSTNWTTILPPPLNAPTTSYTIGTTGFYAFQLQLNTQSQYNGAWIATATQANSFGGQNRVISIATLESYGLPQAPPLINIYMPGDTQLNLQYMPKPGFGTVTGSLAGYNTFPLIPAAPGEVRTYGLRYNVIF